MSTAPSLPPPPRPGLGRRLGEACVRGLCVALLASIPSALRTSAAGGSFFDGLLVSTGVLLPMVTVGLLLIDAAGRGFRNLVASGSPRAIALGVALWIGLSLAPIAKLAAMLQATTHHRGLGGATFAVLALAIVVIAALLARRLVALGDRMVARGVPPGVVAAVGAIVAVVPMLIAAVPLGAHSAGSSDAAVRSTIMDAAIVLVATALAASVELPDILRRLAPVAGIPLAAALFLGAGARVELTRGVGRSLRAGGGFAATLLGVFEHWTDKDGDGEGSHFGGHDCDEGDPTRHTGAVEIPGDGIDQDCDGIDPPAPPRAVVAALAEEAEAAPAGGTTPASIHPGARGAARDGGPRPDVLLITLDTVGAGHASAYGYGRPTTPFLSELAERGVLFAHAYATGVDPQRALTPLVSGRRLQATPHDARTWPTLQPETDTLAERMERAGYRTAAITSFTWLSEERGFAQGFRLFRPVFQEAHPERQVTGGFAVKAAKTLAHELADDPHPLFVWVHLFDAHEIYVAHPGIDLGPGKMGAYDGEVAFVDRSAREIVEAFQAARGGGRTAVIVHGSHGEAFGEHHATGHGGDLFDEVLRVPLIAAIPGGKAGTYDASAVSTLDLARTVADLGGAPADGLEGTSLLPILRGALSSRHGAAYARTQRHAAIVDWPLKLVTNKGHKPTLFDLAEDPGERHDLSASREQDRTRLFDALGAFERPAP